MKGRSRKAGARATTWPRHLAELRAGAREGKLFAGIDLSLNSTGLHVGGHDPMDALGFTTTITPDNLRDSERLDYICENILNRLEPLDIAAVMIEAASFGSGNRAHAKGELHGTVKLALYRAGYFVADIPPQSLKLFASGKGSGKKPAIAVDVHIKWGFRGGNDDETDAFLCSRLLAAMASPDIHGYGTPWRRAIDKIRFEPTRII